MVVVVCAVYLVPYVFLVMTAALQSLDSSLEEASRVSGAKPLRTLTQVVLPALAPSIGAALIIVVIRALTTFVIIAVIWTTAGVQTLPVYIYHLITTFPPQTAQAVILAGGLMLAVQLLLFVQARVVKPHRHATIGGKGGAVRRTRLGIIRPFARAATLSFLLFAAVLPMLAVIVVSLVPFWSSSINWGHMSLHAFQQLFAGGSTTAEAIRNSVIIAGVGASLVVLFAVLAIAPQRSGRGRRVAGVITTLPSMIPHTLVGVAFIVALSGPPFDLYGTIALLLLAYLLMEIPYAARATQAAASAVGVELGEAFRVSGAGEGRTLLRVQVPLMGAGLAGAWIIAFIHMMTEATASSMLAGISNPVVGPQLLGLVTDGTYTQVAALSTIVAIVCSVLVGVMLVIRRRATRRMRAA
jgi:iron(III) transport system permease protein